MTNKLSLTDLLVSLAVTPSDPGPRFVVWLGAGASMDCGIPSAMQLACDLLNVARLASGDSDQTELSDLDIQEWAAKHYSWFDNSNEGPSIYAQAMKHVLPTPQSRSSYLRTALANGRPSKGYRHLASLLKAGVFDTVVTTNFDHMVCQAADRVLPSPVEETVSREHFESLSMRPQHPRLIRLHGDFGHDNLLNVDAELFATPETRFKALERLLTEYGLIVIGYSGSDVSIMKFFIERANNPQFLRHGLYWCQTDYDVKPPLLQAYFNLADGERNHFVSIRDFSHCMERIASQYKVTPETELTEHGDAWARESLLYEFIAHLTANPTTFPTPLIREFFRELHGSYFMLLFCDPKLRKFEHHVFTPQSSTRRLTKTLMKKAMSQMAGSGHGQLNDVIGRHMFPGHASESAIRSFVHIENEQLGHASLVVIEDYNNLESSSFRIRFIQSVLRLLLGGASARVT